MSGVSTVPATVIAVMTSFNRKALTLQCLACFEAACRQAGAEPAAVLMDDGSTDGTADAVRDGFAWVHLLRGDGSLFWSRGMHAAQAVAMQREGDAVHLLWLNDDTLLLPDALRRLLATEQAQRQRHGRPVVVVGATSDGQGDTITYSGLAAGSRLRPFSFRRVFSPTEAVPCHTMNGNIVLLPLPVARAVGNLDPAFVHGGGDIDYGLRLQRAGVPLLVAPGVAGHCRNNPTQGSYVDVQAPLRQRWRHILNRKGLPVGTWLPLTRKHGGWLWPLHFAWPYVKVFGSAWLAALRRH